MSNLYKKIKHFSRNNIVQSLAFLFIFGLVLAIISSFLSKYFGVYLDSMMPVLSNNLRLLLLIYFFYNIIQAIAAPLPVMPFDIAVFAVAGPLAVFVISLLSVLIGYSVSFFLSKKYGKNFLQKVLPHNTFCKINSLSRQINFKHFFIISILPFNQPDLMPYVAGISKIKYKDMIATMAFTLAYRLIFTLLILNKFWIK